MVKLIEKALFGDKQAQKECTEKGAVLPCPCCGGEPYTETFYVRKGWKAVVGCSECPVAITTIIYDDENTAQKKAVAQWNTRPQLVTFCKNCIYGGLDGYACHKPSVDELTDPTCDFCSAGKPKEEK